MSRVEQVVWKCDVCGFEWLRKFSDDGVVIVPVQCPSSKCRSRKWDEGSLHSRPTVSASKPEPKVDKRTAFNTEEFPSSPPAPRDPYGNIDWAKLRLASPPRCEDDQRDPIEILKEFTAQEKFRPQVIEDETEPIYWWAWRMFGYRKPNDLSKVETVYLENLTEED